MSTSSTPFPRVNWGAPLPQLFTRATGPTFWPEDQRYRPLPAATRRAIALIWLLWMQPDDLRAMLRIRFTPTRGDLRWDTPPALPVNLREDYAEATLLKFSANGLCSEVTLTVGLLERLLTAPEGIVGGLTRHYLLTMQGRRLRQLWRETERRFGPEEGLRVFKRALG